MRCLSRLSINGRQSACRWCGRPVNRRLPSCQTVFKQQRGVFLFATIDDLYPFYAVSKLVIGRAGASTLAEVSYFGLPCVLIPLPWAAENHQWVNAGLVGAGMGDTRCAGRFVTVQTWKKRSRRYCQPRKHTTRCA